MSGSLPGTCAFCRFAMIAINGHGEMDVTKRICKKLPPTPIALPAQGGIQIMNFWPTLPSDAGCHSWERRPSAIIEKQDLPRLPDIPGMPGEPKN